MHRSGTSALSGALRILGVTLSQSMQAPHPGVNEKGYWEHLELVQLHDRMLSTLRSSWDELLPLPDRWWKEDAVVPFRREMARIIERDFGVARVWGFKDPRLCRLLPLWLEILEEIGVEARFVLTHRHPGEVAGSLQRRDGFSAPKSGLLWLDYNLGAERWTRGRPRTFTSFDRLLRDPIGTLHQIEEALQIDFPRKLDEATADIREFLSPRLRHHNSSTDDLRGDFGRATALVHACHESFTQACEAGDSGLEEIFDEHGRAYSALVAAFDPALTGHTVDLQNRIGELTDYLRGLQSSALWRAGRRVRRVGRFLRRATSRR